MTQTPPGPWKLCWFVRCIGRLRLFWVLTKGSAYIAFPARLNLLVILVALAAILLMAFDEGHNEALPNSARLDRAETEAEVNGTNS